VAFVALVTIAASTILGATIVIEDRATLREQIFQSHLAAAHLAAVLTRVEIEDAQDDARELANRPSVRAAVQRGEADTLRSELERFMANHDIMDSVGIYDLDGFRMVSGFPNPLNAGVPSSDRDWFREVKGTGQPYLGVPVRSRATNHPAAPYAVPIFRDDGELGAILVAGISLHALSDDITSINVGPSVRANLLDLRGNGVILAHVDSSRILTEISGRNEAASELQRGSSGTLETVSSAGEPVLSSFATVPGFRWGVLILQPSAVAFAPLEAATRRAIMLGALVVIAAAISASLMAVAITRPLAHLRRAARAVADGDLEQRLGFTSGDEIGQLGRDFDRMAHELAARTAGILALQEELRAEAIRDALTGLFNRRYLDATLGRELQRATRHHAPIGVAMLDLDFFKRINDTLGHETGDVVLREVGALLRERSRGEDVAARYGGEELVLVLPGATLADTFRRAESIREGMATLPVQSQLAPVGSVTVSIGVAAYPDSGAEAETLLRAADKALYQAKANGRNRVVIAETILPDPI
jgi:diguanylate cyclase (GGDEF)-like protein